MAVGIRHPGAHDSLVDQVKPVAGVLAEELIEYAAPAIRADPDFQRLEAIVKGILQRGIQTPLGQVRAWARWRQSRVDAEAWRAEVGGRMVDLHNIALGVILIWSWS